MPDVLNLGPFLIKTAWLAIVIGGLVGYWIMKWILKSVSLHNKKVLDLYFNGALIVVATWKFGPVVIHPNLILQNPFNILTTTGTMSYIWAGFIFGAAFIFWKAKKHNLSLILLGDLFPFGFLGLWIVYHLMIPQYGKATTMPWGISIHDPSYQYHPINWYQVIAGLVILVLVWRLKDQLGEGKSISYFLILFGTAEMLISFFKPETPYFLGLSLEQVIYVVMIIVGFVLPSKLADSGHISVEEKLQ